MPLRPRSTILFVALASGCLLAGAAAWSADAPATQPSSSADQVMSDLHQKIQKNPALDPSSPASTDSTATSKPITLNSGVTGTAPKTVAVKTILRREGSFVLNRRARLVFEPSTRKPMVVFNADAQFDFGATADKNTAIEPPLYLLPNQVLESMENQAQDSTDRLEFTISGQITTYRGANYLLLTSIKQTIDKGNFVN